MSIANPYFSSRGGNKVDISLRRRALFASVAVAIGLTSIKLGAYLVTDSISILTSFLDSVFDVLSSAVLLFSVMHASSPADRQHRFGHGKLEAIAALAQSLLLFFSAIYVMSKSLGRFLEPHIIKETSTGIVIMMFSMAITAGLILYQRHVINRTGSIVVLADERHYTGDLLAGGGVIATLLLTQYSDWPYFDPIFAVCVSLVLFRNAYAAGLQSFDILMDRELSDKDRIEIERAVKNHAAVRGMHDLRTRHGGQKSFIEFHLELDGALTLAEVHDIMEEVELAVYKAFPASEVLIHPEPAGIKDHRLDAQIDH